MSKNNITKMFELMEEVDYHLLWYDWFIKSPNPKEITKFNKMNKTQQIKFLKTIERKSKWM